MTAEKPTSTAIKAFTPKDEARFKVATHQGDEAALAEAGRRGASAESIERARVAGTEMAVRVLDTTIDDGVLTEGRASERTEAAQHWRDQADTPGTIEEITESANKLLDKHRDEFEARQDAEARAREERVAEARRKAAAVQAEADNYTGVKDPDVRPEGYESPSEKGIAAAKERVDGMRRV